MNTDYNLLMIDDCDIDAELVKRALTRVNKSVCFNRVENGLEALSYIEDNSLCTLDIPTVVLLDINMPKMSGIEFLKAIKKYEYLKKLLVFVHTSSDNSTDIKTCYEHNIRGYIVKPSGLKSVVDMFSSMFSFLKYVQLS